MRKIFKSAIAVLCLLPVIASAGKIPDLKYKVIISHDDFLAALQCYRSGYPYFKRISPDDVMCLKDVQTVILADGGAQDARIYIRTHVADMERSARGVN